MKPVFTGKNQVTASASGLWETRIDPLLSRWRRHSEHRGGLGDLPTARKAVGKRRPALPGDQCRCWAGSPIPCCWPETRALEYGCADPGNLPRGVHRWRIAVFQPAQFTEHARRARRGSVPNTGGFKRGYLQKGIESLLSGKTLTARSYFEKVLAQIEVLDSGEAARVRDLQQVINLFDNANLRRGARILGTRAC